MSCQYLPYLFYREIHLLRFIFCYCTSIYVINAILLCFFLIIAELCFSHKFLINSFVVFSSIIFCCKQINPQLSKIFDHPHTENTERWIPIMGSADRGEWDRDSDINHLASDNLWQYTTVTNQCWWFPWTWTCHIWYFNCWYHFEKRPGSV